jgi:hypothetical protein
VLPRRLAYDSRESIDVDNTAQGKVEFGCVWVLEPSILFVGHSTFKISRENGLP